MIYYIRDEEGSLIGFKYNNEIYYYIKNMQEDIIGITNNNHELLCRYEYDAWGKIIAIKDNNNQEITDISHIGLINPFRYRSYYYDNETKLYYLNSRYYNPEWGRFINADGIIGANKDILGYNLFAYVSNNPVINSDDNGTSLIDGFRILNSIGKAAKKKVKREAAKTTRNITKMIKTVNNLVDSAKRHFVFEVETGFGIGTEIGVGPLQLNLETTKTFGYSYSEGKGKDYTSTAANVTIGTSKSKFGFARDLRNYDDGTSNPMAMPHEVIGRPNTYYEKVNFLKTERYIDGEFDKSEESTFIGVTLGGYLGTGGLIKIGFNVGG